ncbi:HEAT repeat domain-containing protein [Polyangium sp. 15x6]|uniref:HEAT repeat domain-containing protein n=1 Tax=Polyangium sp. 15x6 TaxID=3042687 RepID=UPI00249C8388|nr:HEAT repeat domain-containing protein [Polyangium sp. 15x6]MDI3290646.1 HEAT repeat domain-containing protein [Polyangium sp. 15x6]
MAKGDRKKMAAVAATLAAVSILGITFGLRRGAEPGVPAKETEAARAASVAPQCRFEPGETAAFTLASTVRDVRGEEEDHLRATLSVEVVEQLSATRYRLRAALSDVSRSQELTLPEERVKGSLTDPFFVDMDASCRFVGFGFARDWDARRRQFVQSLLLTHEFVLPATDETRRWSASQSDGMGPFEANYEDVSEATGSALRMKRRKAAYEGKAQAEALGLSVVVVASEATASFDHDHPRWFASTSGLERVQILVQGQVQADLLQRFRMRRDDTRFVAVRAFAPGDADFRDAFALDVARDPHVDARMAKVSYEEALKAFLAHFREPGDPSYAAARELAAWLAAHPEGAQRLVAALRAGDIDDAARPALFLALELSGTEAARGALSDVLVDRRLRAVDRARAASALSDLGAPTRGTAELLLAQAQKDGDDMVANVSLLGLGSMARRSGDDDELETYVHASLDRELSAAADEGKTRLVLDAMGNSGDPAFADELEAQLGAESASTRQHAAEALGRLDPVEAGPRLLERLREETDPAVRTAIVGALRGSPTADAVALMADKLAASTSIPERAAIITWLGDASRTRPEARGHLVAQFHRETSARLMQLIGTFVPAAALR